MSDAARGCSRLALEEEQGSLKRGQQTTRRREMIEARDFQEIVVKSFQGEFFDKDLSDLLKLLRDPGTFDAQALLTICLKSSDRKRVRQIVGVIFHLYPAKTKEWFSALALPFCSDSSFYQLKGPFYAGLPLALLEMASLYCCDYPHWPADFLRGVVNILGRWLACKMDDVSFDVYVEGDGSLFKDKEYEREMKEVITNTFLVPSAFQERCKETKMRFAGMLLKKARRVEVPLPIAERFMNQVCYTLFRGINFQGRLAVMSRWVEGG